MMISLTYPICKHCMSCSTSKFSTPLRRTTWNSKTTGSVFRNNGRKPPVVGFHGIVCKRLVPTDPTNAPSFSPRLLSHLRRRRVRQVTEFNYARQLAPNFLQEGKLKQLGR